MAKILDPKNIDRRICHSGVYIYFYNSNYKGLNKSIVDHINKLASEYPALYVFEVNWEKYCAYMPGTQIEEMHKVYLHCDNKKEHEKFMPDKNDINCIFLKAIKLYNDRIERKIQNIGLSKIKRPITEKDDRTILKEKLQRKERMTKIFLNAKIIPKYDLAKSKLEITKDENLLNNSLNTDKEKTKHNMNSETENINAENKNTLNNENSHDLPWFYDTKIDDLPSDIFSDNPKVDFKGSFKSKSYGDNDIPIKRSRISKSQKSPEKQIFSKQSLSNSIFSGSEISKFGKLTNISYCNEVSSKEINLNNTKLDIRYLLYYYRVFSRPKKNRKPRINKQKTYQDYINAQERNYCNIQKNQIPIFQNGKYFL